MDSATKRKAAGAAASENDARPSKRQKLPADADAASETKETTTAMGLKFLESLRAAKDKTGRPIATHFLTLPDKDELPEYYEVIKLPIAIDTIEDKLNAGEYERLAEVESDCKRLVNNAKSYNDKKSIIYEDAERLRKTASNWMVKHNPAYRRDGYIAIATPIPGEEVIPPGKPIPRVAAATPRSAVSTPDSSERPSRRAAAAPQSTPAPSKLRHSASAAPEQEDEGPDFDGKNFQQAQDQIIKELMEYVDPESDLQIFQPFVNLPSRSLKDYYQLIKNPMSLSAVQKKVRGVVGREPPTGKTLLKSWKAFEEEISLIWENARIYNEDGSDIYNVSLELEEIFKQRVENAKAKVEEPPQPKLKLNMSTAPKQQLRIKLRQSPGSDPNTPGGRSSATPGVIVDNDALLRQQRHVHDSMNGNKNSRPSSSGKPQTPASANPFNSTRGGSASIPVLDGAAVNGIKSDIQSPALNSIRPASTTSDGQRVSVPAQTPFPVMPPPHGLSRPASGSPHPNGGIGQTGSYHPPNYYVPPTTQQFDHFRKKALKNANEALIPKITLMSAPSAALQKPWTMVIPASKTKSSHSITISIPHTLSHLHIVPYLPVALEGRAYRIFCHINTKITSDIPRHLATPGINGASNYDAAGKIKGEPLYDAKLALGVNRIEVEVIAEKKEKVDSKDAKDQVEIEKCTIFVNLMR